MDRKKIIEALENSLDNAETTERKMRLHYLLAKLYLSINDSWAISHLLESQDLLEYAGENGLVGFRNFYRYREKLENLEGAIEPMICQEPSE